MILEPNHIYHIYNQGNNRQKIFFNQANYLYFLKKIKQHILPFADILAWCLMPNHFHLLVVVREDQTVKPGQGSDRVTWSHPVTGPPATSPLNNSIAVMLRSYTRAINIEQGRTGSLFREGTKANLIGSMKREMIKCQNRRKAESNDHRIEEENDLQICFNYIHNNPVKAGLVTFATDWEFSSARDIAELRAGSLINKDMISSLGLNA